MGSLVSLREVKSYLGLAQTDAKHDALLEGLATRIEAVLARAKNRTFGKAGEAITATLDGPDHAVLWLARPVQTLTAVVIGQNPASPVESLTPGAGTVIADGRRLVRQDGGVFPAGVANVHVTYTTASALDEDARQAVLEGIALVYRARGSEDAGMEVLNSFTHVMRKSFDELPSWQAIPKKPVIL